MYKRILVPLDSSPLGDRVLPYVRLLGRKMEAKVELYRVFDPQPEFFFPDEFQLDERRQAEEHYREEVMTGLGQAKIRLEEAGVSAQAVIHGPDVPALEAPNPGGGTDKHTYSAPAEHIVKEADREDDTLIVMSTHGRSGLGRWIMGSVTDKVLLIIRAQGNDAVLDGAMGHVIVRLDGSALAKALEAKVCLVRAKADAAEPGDEEREGLKKLAKKIRDEGVADVEEVVLTGDPATAVVDLTHEYPDALVTMTTHGRSGLGRWIMGNVADRVVRHAAGPVLVLRGG